MKSLKLPCFPVFGAIAIFVGISQWLMMPSLNAQEVAGTPREAIVNVEEASAPKKTLIDQYKTGGWAMYPLTFFSIAGLGLIVYNFMAVKPTVILRPDAVQEVDKALEVLDIEKAKSICVENPAPATNIIAAGLNRVNIANYEPEPIKEAIEEASSEELAGPFV